MKSLFLIIQISFYLITASIPLYALNKIKLIRNDTLISLSIDQTSYSFTRQNNRWAFSCAFVNGKPVAIPVSHKDGFLLNGGEAARAAVLKNTSSEIEICFSGFSNAQVHAKVYYEVFAKDVLPRLVVTFEGFSQPTIKYRTAWIDENEHGAWVTRGETATDKENKEVFIDASGPFVFGHCTVNNHNVGYVIQAFVHKNINPRGKSE